MSQRHDHNPTSLCARDGQQNFEMRSFSFLSLYSFTALLPKPTQAVG